MLWGSLINHVTVFLYLNLLPSPLSADRYLDFRPSSNVTSLFILINMNKITKIQKFNNLKSKTNQLAEFVVEISCIDSVVNHMFFYFMQLKKGIIHC